MVKQIEILFGDDEFKDPFTTMAFEGTYIPRLQKQFEGYLFNWNCVTSHQEVIREAQSGKYQVVVTDLDYTGAGRGKEGYEVVDAVSKLNPRPTLVLCTSSDNKAEIERKTKGKIDYRAGTAVGHKFGDLINILAEHFKTA